MTVSSARLLLGVFLMILVLTPGLRGEVATFVRIVEQPDGARWLQTLAASYRHPSGVRVTILATVHQAHADYYDQIQSRCDAADGVVFEGIVRPVPVRLISELPLNWQIQRLRLTGGRYLRGDLSAAEYDEVRDQSTPVAPTPATLEALATSILQAQVDPNMRQATERAFAVLPRNAAAMTSLRHRLSRGDQHVILLYGASHAADLQSRIASELGFKLESIEWLGAFKY